jgi:hypothetical protein
VNQTLAYHALAMLARLFRWATAKWPHHIDSDRSPGVGANTIRQELGFAQRVHAARQFSDWRPLPSFLIGSSAVTSQRISSTSGNSTPYSNTDISLRSAPTYFAFHPNPAPLPHHPRRKAVYDKRSMAIGSLDNDRVAGHTMVCCTFHWLSDSTIHILDRAF